LLACFSLRNIKLRGPLPQLWQCSQLFPVTTGIAGTNRPKTGYNLLMQVAVLAMRVLEVMFFLGLAGSTVVVLISFVEDAKELFGRD
jgi:hypothetical protein